MRAEVMLITGDDELDGFAAAGRERDDREREAHCQAYVLPASLAP
jgi:hypothetical protein